MNNFLQRPWSDATGLSSRRAVGEFCRAHQGELASPGSIHAWALVRERRNAPDSLLTRLLRCRSDVPLGILCICIILDPELTADPRELARPREFRRWLTVPNDDAGCKQMDRALRTFRRIQIEWFDETEDYHRGGHASKAKPAWHPPQQVAALRLRKVKPRPEFWSQGWYLAMSKGGLAWALATMAVGRQPRESMRAPLFGFTKHVTGKTDQGNCFADDDFGRLDAWTALALWAARTTWPEVLSMLNPRTDEVLRGILRGCIDPGTAEQPSEWLPTFLTDQRIHIAFHSKDRPRPYGYQRIPWQRIKSVSASRTGGRRTLVVAVEGAGNRQIPVVVDPATDLKRMCALANELSGRRRSP